MMAESGKFESRNLICSICCRQFDRPSRLRSHLLTHSGEKPICCPFCNKGFATKGNCMTHMRTHTQEKPYQCPHCDKKYSQHSQLVIHIRVHTGEKPYVCSVCKKAFTCSKVLKNHLRTHSGEKPYICEFCSKGFATYGNLVVHRRTHTKERPYVCKLCGRGFEHSGNLSRHSKGHAMADGSVRCMICGQVFGVEGDLSSHSLEEHSLELEKEDDTDLSPIETSLQSQSSMQVDDNQHDLPTIDTSSIELSSVSNLNEDSYPLHNHLSTAPNVDIRESLDTFRPVNEKQFHDTPNRSKSKSKKKRQKSEDPYSENTKIINKSPVKLIISNISYNNSSVTDQNNGIANIASSTHALPGNKDQSALTNQAKRADQSLTSDDCISDDNAFSNSLITSKKAAPPDLIPITHSSSETEEILILDENSKESTDTTIKENRNDIKTVNNINSYKIQESNSKEKLSYNTPSHFPSYPSPTRDYNENTGIIPQSRKRKINVSISNNLTTSPHTSSNGENMSTSLNLLRTNIRHKILLKALDARRSPPDEFRKKVEHLVRRLVGDEKLKFFGYPGKNIEQVLVSILDMANMEPCADVRIDEIKRLKQNTKKLMEWVIPDRKDWEHLHWTDQPIDNILDTLHTWFLPDVKYSDHLGIDIRKKHQSTNLGTSRLNIHSGVPTNNIGYISEPGVPVGVGNSTRLPSIFHM